MYKNLCFTYPNTVAVICVNSNNVNYMMPSVWQIPLSHNPMLFGVLISPKRNTYKYIVKERNYTMNYFSVEHSTIVNNLGTVSGRDQDKQTRYEVALGESKCIASPCIKKSYLSLECELVKVEQYGDHVLMAARVLHVRSGEEISSDGTLNERIARPLLYLGKGRYTTISSEVHIEHVQECP